MSMRNMRVQPEMLARAGIFVIISTVVLTASFLGVVGLFTDRVSGLSARLPFYVLVMAICFVVAIIGFESVFHEGEQILLLAILGSVVSLLIVTLGGEGVVYLLRHTEQVVASHLLFYILSAGLIGTGLCYWVLQHWAELADSTPGL